MVTAYKYLGIMDQNLSFEPHIEGLVCIVKLKFIFFCRNKSCFSLPAKKPTWFMQFFLPLPDCVDLLFMYAPEQYPKKLDTVQYIIMPYGSLLAVEITFTTVFSMLSQRAHLCLSADTCIVWHLFINLSLGCLLYVFALTCITVKSIQFVLYKYFINYCPQS